MLDVINATKFKKALLKILKEVESGNSYLIIRKGRSSAVLLNIDEYESLIETVKFLENKDFLKKLLKKDEKD